MHFIARFGSRPRLRALRWWSPREITAQRVATPQTERIGRRWALGAGESRHHIKTRQWGDGTTIGGVARQFFVFLKTVSRVNTPGKKTPSRKGGGTFLAPPPPQLQPLRFVPAP